MSKEEKWGTWKCRKCGHIVVSKGQPEPIHWGDGHVCIFYPEEEIIKKEKRTKE